MRDPDQALVKAVAAEPDWAGGTRVAEGLRLFVDDHGRRGLARGAVVVVLSDGWSQEDPELVGVQMARLTRLAYRIIWVNPRKEARAPRGRDGRRPSALRRVRQRAQPRGARRVGRGDPRAIPPAPEPHREKPLIDLDSASTVTAPFDQVWASLMDFQEVAGCVPGAEILNKLNEDASQVGMKVKLGPVTI